MTTLASQLRLRSGAVLKNRIAKAATEEALADAYGNPTTELAHLYGRWSQGGAGLLITGHVIVDREHRGRARDVVVDGHDEGRVAALRAWAASARSGGSEAWMQLNHAGRQTPRVITREPTAPSAGAAVKMLGNFGRPRAMTPAEIDVTVLRFARAALTAKKAGFTGVQVHAAHGYLLSQFLSPLTNQRTDAYGGSLENRARLLIAIVRAVREATGDDFAVAVKLNSADFQRGGFEADDFRAVAKLLDREAVDLIEISGGSYESFAFFGEGEGQPKSVRTAAREAYFLDVAKKVRADVKLPLMLTGGFRTRAGMDEALAKGVDVVGMARPLIVEPELAARLLSGEATGAVPLKARRAPKSLTALAEGAWYWSALTRIARGLEPDLHASTWGAIAKYVSYDLATALFAPKPNQRKALLTA